VRSRLVILALACAFVATLDAAIAGTPLPPTPGSVPTAWLTVGNDNLGLESVYGIDDNRTSQEALVGRFGESVIIVLDHSILTDCEHGTRSDELTPTVGWLPFGPGDDEAPWVALGIGGRFSGNLRGQNVQNGVHSAQNFSYLELVYDSRQSSALGYIMGERSLWLLPWAGIEMDATLLATTYGEVQGEVAEHGVLRFADATLWAGLRWSARNGVGQGRTARSVATFERGLWIDYGLSWRWLALSGSVDPGTGHSYGVLSLVVRE